MYELVKQNRKFDGPAQLFQISVHEKSFPVLSANKKHSALSFTIFKEASQKKRNF